MDKWKLLAVGGITALLSTVAVMVGIDRQNNSFTLINKSGHERLLIQSAEVIKAKPGDEIVSKRTANSKHYKITNNKFRAEIKMQPEHYLDPMDGLYKEPDLTVKEITVEAKTDPNRTHDKYVDPGNGLPKTTWFDGEPDNYTFYHPGGDSVKYHCLFDMQKIDVALVYEAEITKEYITLDDAADGNTLSWIIESSAQFELRGREVYYTDTEGNFLFRNPAPWARDATGKDIPITVTLGFDLLKYTLDIPESVTYPITVDPSTTTQSVLDGSLETYSGQYSGGAGTGARDTLTANTQNSILCGQICGSLYMVQRGQASFPLDGAWSTNIATVTAVSMNLWMLSDQSTIDFTVALVPSTKKGTLSPGWFNDFSGWQATGVYYPVYYNTIGSTADMTVGQYNAIDFSAAGCDSVFDNIGDSLHVALISDRDIGNITPPTGNENVAFAGSGTGGKEPYLSITYTSIVPTGFTMVAVVADSMTFTWNDIYNDEDGYIIVSASDSNYAISDTLGADVETITVGGLTPDSLYACKVRIIDYTDGWYGMSAADSEATNPALPTGLAVVPAHQDTVHYTFSANSNPVTTTYAMAIIGSDGDTLWVDFTPKPDTLRTSNGGVDSLYTWGWARRDSIVAFSDSGLIYIPNYTGETLDYYMYSEGQDDGD